jgi:hypothetical protein
MDLRVASARRQGLALAKKGIDSLAGHDAAASRESDRERHDLIVVANPVAYARGGVVLVNEVEKLADEPVGPGSANARRFPGAAPDPWTANDAQLLASSVGRNRIESTRHYPDNDVVRSRLVARFVAPQLGWSVRTIESGEPRNPVTTGKSELRNGIVAAKIDGRNAVSLSVGDVTLDDLLLIEDRSDRGDLYTPSIGAVIARAEPTRQMTVHEGPLVGELAQVWSLVPQKRGATESAVVGVAMRIVADSPLLELRINGVNRGKNHRLRIGINTGLAGATVIADAAFGPIERKPIVVPDDDRRIERPPPTAPLHRYVSLFSKSGGVTVHSDGLAEYEADANGVVWVTLVRAVGQLSRNNLPERPGHAGWPEPTPKAQSLGPFKARLAIQIHGPSSAATVQVIDRESDRFLNPMRGFTLRSSIASPGLAGGIELSGTALSASAIKESENGRAIILRCVNLSDREQSGTWTLPVPVESAHLARLDETTVQGLDARDDDGRAVIAFTAGPRAVITILVTPRVTQALVTRTTPE